MHVPDELKVLPRRNPDSHKGDFGRVLLVAGSYGMHGAAALAASAAFRSGVGLLTLACPQSIYPLVGAMEPRATYLPLADHDGGLGSESEDLLFEATLHADVVALGPGMGTRPGTVELIRSLVPRIDCPLVLDADGLNAFAGQPARISGKRPSTVVTPHPGELSRLTGKRPESDEQSRRIAAIDLAMRCGGTVILKGRHSIVTDGMETFVNETGNPGMATGGSGDVLTGCLAALLAILPQPLMAARAACFAHGAAGDLAAQELGEIGVTATDLTERLPAALIAMQSSEASSSP